MVSRHELCRLRSEACRRIRQSRLQSLSNDAMTAYMVQSDACDSPRVQLRHYAQHDRTKDKCGKVCNTGLVDKGKEVEGVPRSLSATIYWLGAPRPPLPCPCGGSWRRFMQA